jgi:hypothetical protein
MRNFKSYLTENKKPSWFYTTEEQVISWMSKLGFTKSEYSINDKLEIIVERHSPIIITDSDLVSSPLGQVLPVQFDRSVSFSCLPNSKIASFIGCPRTVIGHFRFSTDTITSIEGFPSKITNECIIKHANITDFTNIEKYLQSADSIYLPSVALKILPLLKVEHIQSLFCFSQTKTKLQDAVTILNKHLKSKDILACQSELIEAGLKDYAKL